MEKENKYITYIKHLFYVGIIGVLFTPLLQMKYSYFSEKELHGAIEAVEQPKLSVDSWLSGEYQNQSNDYFNQNFGFRPYFVRLHNQFYYSTFNEPKARDVVVGKDDFLFEENYIKAYLGRDFIGKKEIEEKIHKLDMLKDTLSKRGVELLIVFAPGKGSFYSEYIPEKYEPAIKSTTNYEVYQKSLVANDFNFIDFNSWFLAMKDTTSFPLFPKTGIHWSKYGELIAADSMIKYIADLTGREMPEIRINDVIKTDIMWDSDNDVEKGMNLFFNIKDLEMAYPQFEILHKDKTEAKVLTVADSYFWGVYNWGLSRDVFAEGQFWFYNEAIYPDSYDQPLNVKDIDIITEVEKNDVVVLLSTDANLYKFAFGFIDQLYDAYFLKTNTSTPTNVL
ncbi:MAG TPA: hypothetical protein EYG86_05440 [Crocinitomicaceae bacterium]|nr:hypothetical protein [Crocinitomicaceae bacterium]